MNTIKTKCGQHEIVCMFKNYVSRDFRRQEQKPYFLAYLRAIVLAYRRSFRNNPFSSLNIARTIANTFGNFRRSRCSFSLYGQNFDIVPEKNYVMQKRSESNERRTAREHAAGLNTSASQPVQEMFVHKTYIFSLRRFIAVFSHCQLF